MLTTTRMQQGRQGYRRQHTARELGGRYSKFTFYELPLRVNLLKPSGAVGTPAGLLHTESVLTLHHCQH